MKKLLIIGAVLTMAAPAHAGFIDIGQAFGQTLQPYINALVEAGIAALVSWVAYLAKNKFHVDIEAQYRDALTAFLQRQASSLIADGAVKLQGTKVEVKNDAIAQAANTAIAAIPDALKFFGLTTDQLRSRILDLIPQQPAVAQALAIAIDTKNPETPTAAAQIIPVPSAPPPPDQFSGKPGF